MNKTRWSLETWQNYIAQEGSTYRSKLSLKEEEEEEKEEEGEEGEEGDEEEEEETGREDTIRYKSWH